MTDTFTLTVQSPFDGHTQECRIDAHFIRAGATSIMASSRYDPYELAKAPSFDAFVRIIAAEPDCRKAYDTLRPQAAFVTDENGRVLVDRLFAFNDLRNGRLELQAWIGAGSLPHVNETAAAPVHCSAATHALIDHIYAEDRGLYRLVGEAEGAHQADSGY